MTFSSDGRGEPTPFFNQIVNGDRIRRTARGDRHRPTPSAATRISASMYGKYISMLNRLAMLFTVLSCCWLSILGKPAFVRNGRCAHGLEAIPFGSLVSRKDGGDKGEAVDPDLRT